MYTLGTILYDRNPCRHDRRDRDPKKDCFHNGAEVVLVFRQGHGVLVQNARGLVRRLAPNSIGTERFGE